MLVPWQLFGTSQGSSKHLLFWHLYIHVTCGFELRFTHWRARRRRGQHSTLPETNIAVFTFRCQERNMTNQILVASPSILSMAPIEWHHHGVMVRISQETWTSWGCDLCIFLLLYWADRLGISLETHCAGVQLWTSRRKTGWVLKSHF